MEKLLREKWTSLAMLPWMEKLILMFIRDMMETSIPRKNMRIRKLHRGLLTLSLLKNPQRPLNKRNGSLLLVALLKSKKMLDLLVAKKFLRQFAQKASLAVRRELLRSYEIRAMETSMLVKNGAVMELLV
jgi:hypothetical protein